MSKRETERLRVLIANERRDRLALVAPIVAALGHEVIAREIEVDGVGAVTARERPDVALVGLGESSQYALELIEKIVHEASCPVILLIHETNPDFVREASKRSIFAYITDDDRDGDAHDWQSSIDIVFRRFTEYNDLECVRAARRDGARQGDSDGAPLGGRGRRLRHASVACAHHEPEARRRGRRRCRRARAAAEASRLGLRPTLA